MLENVWEFLQCVKKKKKKKLEQRGEMKINFINLFGLEVKKLIFKVLQCKTEEN